MIIGREYERDELLSLQESDKSEFVAIYGRRRVGKTFLIRETFNYKFTFQHTGLQNAEKEVQLQEFATSLKNAGMKEVRRPHTWFEAFSMLGQLLSSKKSKKKIVFIDELPWLDTPKSNFVSALDHFWNGWANARKDIVLIICGSATSWIISNIIKNYGGLHNRLTRQIYLEPFTLYECEQYSKAQHLGMNRRNILETYMVIGGIPYYWSLLKKNMSWSQNIDNLFFNKHGELRNEFNALYASLFRNSEPYVEIVTALGTKKIGMTRDEIKNSMQRNLGGKLSIILRELEECDFIRSYSSMGKKKKDTIYQLIDNYSLFYFKFIAGKNITSKNYWSQTLRKAEYSSWSGLAFERVCFQHIEQIKKALGISGIISNVYSWIYKSHNPTEQGVQIDMLIDRDDNIINLCEIKFSKDEYEITAAYDRELHRKASTFGNHSHTKKGISIVMITLYGITRNQWSNDISNVVIMDDLFEKG